MTIPEDELTIDIQLRPINDVAHRMVILAALVEIALTLADPDDDRPIDQIEQELTDLSDALLIGESASYLTEQELNYLESDWSSLDEQSLGEMLWRVEALEALSCATTTRQSEHLSPWLRAEPVRLIGTIPAPWDEIESFLSALQFQPVSTIAKLREIAELWVWRGAVDEELRTASGRARSELLTAVSETAAEATNAQLLDAADGDFLVDDTPYHKASDETKAVISQVSYQKLWALNWLCGFGESWDDVPLDI